MSAFKKVALLRSHQILPNLGKEYISDLVELASLAAVIRDQVEDVTIPVGSVDRDPLGAFRRYVRKESPDLVGISSFTCGIKSGFEYARIAKQSGAYVVMGGYHPTARPADVLGSGFVDAVVRGEGEVTFEQLVREGPGEEIPGLSWVSGNAIHHSPDRAPIQELDKLPLPLRSARPPRFGRSGSDYHTDTIYTSRGCRAKCAFCANNLIGKAWRKRSGESILRELLMLVPVRKGETKRIKFWDANFITEVERIDHLCDLILDHRLERYFTFSAETRLEDIVRAREILGKMYEAGFRTMSTGVESPSRATQQLLRKGVNLGNVSRAVSLLEQHGIRARQLYIIGHPTENQAEVLNYVDFSLSQGSRNQASMFFVMTPYPGTGTFDYYDKQGLITSYDWDLYNNFGSVVSPNGISQRRLQALLGSVNIKYKTLAAFHEDKPYQQILRRMLSYLLTYIKISYSNREYSDEELQAISWETLRNIACEATRPLGDKQTSRFWRRIAIKCYDGDQESVLIQFRGGTDSDSLVVETGNAAHRCDHKRHLHISMQHLRMIAERIDVRLLSNVIYTIKFNWTSLQAHWVPQMALMSVKLGMVAVSMLAFQLRKTLESRVFCSFKKGAANVSKS